MQVRQKDVTQVTHSVDCAVFSFTWVTLIYYPTFISVPGFAGLRLCCPAPAVLVAGLAWMLALIEKQSQLQSTSERTVCRQWNDRCICILFSIWYGSASLLLVFRNRSHDWNIFWLIGWMRGQKKSLASRKMSDSFFMQMQLGCFSTFRLHTCFAEITV